MGRGALITLLLSGVAAAEAPSVRGQVRLSVAGPDGKPVPSPNASGVSIAIEERAGAARHAARHYEMRQKDKHFDPDFLVIQVGDAVDFINDDKWVHNVFSASKARSFDIGKPPMGAVRSITFDTAGQVDVFCDIHASMRATIVVVPDGPMTKTDDSGAFAVGGLKPGTHNVFAWRGPGSFTTGVVTVEAGKVGGVTLDVVEPALGAHRRLHGEAYRDGPAYSGTSH